MYELKFNANKNYFQWTKIKKILNKSEIEWNKYHKSYWCKKRKCELQLNFEFEYHCEQLLLPTICITASSILKQINSIAPPTSFNCNN